MSPSWRRWLSVTGPFSAFCSDSARNRIAVSGERRSCAISTTSSGPFGPEPQDLAACLAGPNGPERVVELAHDLRSPLTAALCLAEAAQTEANARVRGRDGRVR